VGPSHEIRRSFRGKMRPKEVDRSGLEPRRHLSGTEGSNPASSTEESANSARDRRSRCGNRISPLIRRLGSEDPERRTRDEMGLKVEGVVNGSMHAEEALGGAS